MADSALVFLNGELDPRSAGTHVIVIGVGQYAYGDNGATRTEATIVDDLTQLTSPPISARAIADWFIESFHHAAKPLASLSLLVSGDSPKAYRPQLQPGAINAAPASGNEPGAFLPPQATLHAVQTAAREWSEQLKSNQDNMAVFYFCGHGIASGEEAALLLQDFGSPGNDFDGAIDVNLLLGAMKNSPAVQQIFLFDCCRTNADDLYENQSIIGSRIVSLPMQNRGHTVGAQQFVLFPSLDGEEAFGVRNEISVFTRSIIDALSFAAADFSTGEWVVTTGNLLSQVDRLVRSRVPSTHINRSKPNSPNATSFDINQIGILERAKSIVSLSDPAHWGNVRIECIEPRTGRVEASIVTNTSDSEKCGRFDIVEGLWKFTGVPTKTQFLIKDCDRHIRLPVAYITLSVVP